MKEFEETKHRLHNEMMDDTHKEFLTIYNGADTDSIESIKRHLQRLHSHTVKHFGDEELLMIESEYLGKSEHLEEHRKVLAEMEYFIKMEPTLFGRNMLKGYYTQILPEWFDRHLRNQDSDLASHIKKGALNAY